MASMNSDIRVRSSKNGLLAGLIIGAAVLALVVSISVSLLPFTASAFGGGSSFAISITNINGNSSPFNFSCPANPLYSPVSLSGSGSAHNAPGHKSQYHVQIDWGDASTTNNLGTFVGDDDDFTFTFAAGPHIYSTGGIKTIKARLYHNGVPGNDGQADQVISVTTCVVTVPANHAPVATSDSITTPEDTAATITLAGTDADSNSLTFSTSTNPLHGTLTLVGTQATYTPNANYSGADSFTFRAYDGTAYSTPATITITVTPVNDAPVAIDDVYGAQQDATSTIAVLGGVLTNDTDVEHNALTATWISGPTFGYLVFHTDGSFEYAPQAGYVGDDSFTYKANDGTADSNNATVTIHVAANNVPVAAADAYATNEDTVLNVAAAGVLANDFDADADALTAVLVTGPAHGTLTLNADGSFDYTPAANWSGSDSFVYKANDTKADSSGATVTLTVNPVNDAPAVTDLAVATVQDTAVSGAVLGTDADNDTLTFSVVGGTATGTLLFNTDGTFTYTPASGFVGTDAFTFKANDGTADSNVATTTITVAATPIVVVTPPSNGGGNGGGGGGSIVSGPFSIGFVNTNNGGQVLGTSTEALPEGCSIYLNTYLKLGAKNDVSEVKKLQSFLNSYMNAALPVTGVFGPMTFKAVQAFQLKHADDVLAPWLPFGLASDHSATGYVYKTTKYKINLIQCATLNLPKPQLP